MTREEAISKVRSADISGVGISFGLVDALVALGLLKLDTPATIHKAGVKFIAEMAKRWIDNPQAVADDLAAWGAQIVRAE